MSVVAYIHLRWVASGGLECRVVEGIDRVLRYEELVVGAGWVARPCPAPLLEHLAESSGARERKPFAGSAATAGPRDQLDMEV